MLQRLAGEDPGAFGANLARSLNNLGTILGSLGRFSEALEMTSRGLNLRTSVAEVYPGTYLLGDLAAIDTRMALADSFLNAGERETALRLLIESFDMLKPADAQKPAEVAGRLDSMLDRITGVLEESGLIVDSTRIAALEHAVESVALFFRKRPLAFADPMNTVLLTYLAALRRVGKEPNRELLRHIIQIVEKEIIRDSSGLALRPGSGE